MFQICFFFSSFLNIGEASHFRLNAIHIRGDESLTAVIMNHAEEIPHHHTPSSRLFWNLGVGFQFWKLRINRVFLHCFSNARKAEHILPFKTFGGCSAH